jgi:REP element-mobilizing transposase RayT
LLVHLVLAMRSHEEFRDEHFALAYLITFRTYGTWLHGRRGSIDRFHKTYGRPKLPPDKARWDYNRKLLNQDPVTLTIRQRIIVEQAIREICEARRWSLQAINVRTNHIHTVVTALCKPERVLNAFKANATRKLRAAKYWHNQKSPWARHGSTRYLWTEEQVLNAIAYVLYDQGEPLDR